MKVLNALFVLRIAASVMTIPIEVANDDLVVTPCNWNDVCFIICSDESEPAAELTDRTGLDPAGVMTQEEVTILNVPTGSGICGVDWTSGLVWAEDIDVDEDGAGSLLALDTSAEDYVKRELDVAAHANWEDTLDVGGHVDWNDKANTKAET